MNDDELKDPFVSDEEEVDADAEIDEDDVDDMDDDMWSTDEKE